MQIGDVVVGPMNRFSPLRERDEKAAAGEGGRERERERERRQHNDIWCRGGFCSPLSTSDVHAPATRGLPIKKACLAAV